MVVKIGTFGNDLLIGSNGADSLLGSFGNDLLRGLGGNDTLDGGGDNDTLNGGSGNDSLFGQGGIDTALFNTATDVEVDLGAGYAQSSGLGVDTISSIENVTTGSGDDLIFGNGFANILISGEGDDSVFSGDGDDVITTGAGVDDVYGGDGDDVIGGGGGADILAGGYGDDEINGGNGNDLIHGGEDVDALSGGAGADRFYFQIDDSGVGAGNRDAIADFGDGNDWISLAFDDLDFIGTAPFSAAGQVRFVHSDGNTIVKVNTEGHIGAEMEIELTGIINLNAGDFLL